MLQYIKDHFVNCRQVERWIGGEGEKVKEKNSKSSETCQDFCHPLQVHMLDVQHILLI